MTENMAEDYVSLKEVLNRLGISRARFYQLGLEKVIPRERREGRWYYDSRMVETVAKALAHRRQGMKAGQATSDSPIQDIVAVLRGKQAYLTEDESATPSTSLLSLLQEIRLLCVEMREMIREMEKRCQQAQTRADATSIEDPRWRFLSIGEVAQMLGVSRRLVSGWVNDGTLPAYRMGPAQRLVRVRLSDLEDFLERWRIRGTEGGEAEEG